MKKCRPQDQVSVVIDLQLACAHDAHLPGAAEIDRWVTATFLALGRARENVTVRIVNEEEITDLNHRYRGQDKPTNVLAFPFEAVPETDYRSLGDIVICLAVVKNESHQQHKPVQSHFAQMVIHGTLHLCGFDHQTDDQAAAMEELEKSVLANIGVN